jgi:hypothetical protein
MQIPLPTRRRTGIGTSFPLEWSWSLILGSACTRWWNAVVDFPDHFYYEGKFYRNVGAEWEVSVTFGGSWSVAASTAIPVGLHKHKPHRQKGAHPGRGPAKVKKKY